METKKCPRCKEVKPFSGWYSNRSSKDGLSSYCRECIKTMWKEKRAEKWEEKAKDFPPSPRASAFADWLLENRKQRGMTQEELGRNVGATGSQVRLWEKGKVIPRGQFRAALAKFFNVELPLSLQLSMDNHLPLDIGRCANCGKAFPIYKGGVETCSKKCGYAIRDQRGENNPAWGGGKMRGSGGYIRVKAPDHPHADSGGYLPEHRLVMEAHLGRYLLPSERVHHKNGVRTDNRLENLELWTDGRKDPPGQRVSDLTRDFLSRLPEDERKRILEEFLTPS